MGFRYAKKIFQRLWRSMYLGVMLARRRGQLPLPTHPSSIPMHAWEWTIVGLTWAVKRPKKFFRSK